MNTFKSCYWNFKLKNKIKNFYLFVLLLVFACSNNVELSRDELVLIDADTIQSENKSYGISDSDNHKEYQFPSSGETRQDLIICKEFALKNDKSSIILQLSSPSQIHKDNIPIVIYSNRFNGKTAMYSDDRVVLNFKISNDNRKTYYPFYRKQVLSTIDNKKDSTYYPDSLKISGFPQCTEQYLFLDKTGYFLLTENVDSIKSQTFN